MPGALLTDLYELNMAASYLRREMTGPATFSLYVRNLPPSRGFMVAAGLETCLDALESFSFDEDELGFLRTIGFEERDVEAFRGLRFDGAVWAVPEGRIVHAGEPLMEITASLPAAQLVETLLLNQVTLHMTVATKAARYRSAAPDSDLVDFAFRRTHGRDAAMAVARASAIVGFSSTSNVEAARRYGLEVAGTMAHSFIEAFPSEIDAFRAYAEDHPARTTFLVDTYDTLQGVANAIEVVRAMQLTGRLGIRLDSGDLLNLSRAARKLLDEAGLTQVRIFASGGLDELEVQDLVREGAPLDAFGIGTQMGVSADAPFVDSVYKLVDIGGRPVLKLSAGKATAPGRKQVWRGRHHDVLALRDEPGVADGEPLLEPVMHDGVRTVTAPTLAEMRARFDTDLAALPDAARLLRDAVPVEVRHSDALVRLTTSTRDEALRRSGADDAR
jgi:nicotinate phosphoribosyltransferase